MKKSQWEVKTPETTPCALWKQRGVHTVVMLSRTSISSCHLVICAWAHIFSLKAKLQYTAKMYFISFKTRNTFSLSHFTSLTVIWALDHISSNLHILFTKWSMVLLICVFTNSLCPSLPIFSNESDSLQLDIIS